MQNPFLLALALLAAAPAAAQTIVFSRHETIPVSRNGQPITLPWAGGLHAPQFSQLDLNNDGLKDLIVFDRGDNNVLPFLNNGNTNPNLAYTYAPLYARAFPKSLNHWMLLKDYNCDGKEDLFTSNDNDGITVFTNTSSGGNVQFTLAHPGLSTTTGFQLEVPATDIPAITDVDNDGDLDILAFDFAGSYVVWYRNNQSCGILNFSIGSGCWGEFSENAFNSNITLNVSCRTGQLAQNQSPANNLHAGSSLLIFDANADGKADALVGDISSSQMIFLQNGPANAMVSQTQSYPASNPADLFIFPAGFLVDSDNDNLQDLIIAPNVGSDPGGKNYEQVLRYKNTGTAANPVFTYQNNEFLSNQMLDFGSGSAPAFFDEDGDGDLDLVVGNFAYRSSPSASSSQLALLRNTGTNAAPAYNLVNTDYLGLSALSAQFLTDLSPAFGDLDGDGDHDLLLGRNDGKLMYYRNTSAAGQPASFTFVTDTYEGLNVGLLSKPQIIDLNRDNLPDLVIGNRNGALHYYRNTGSAATAVFTQETTTLGNITLFSPNFGPRNAAPFIADFDGNGNYDLAVGDRLGKVHFYPNIEGNLTGTFTETGNTFYEPDLNHLLDTLTYGQRAAPTAADLTGDGKPDLIVGGFRGGLRVYKNMNGQVAAPEAVSIPDLNLWPNPTTGKLHFSAGLQAKLTARVFSSIGTEIRVPVSAEGEVQQLDLSTLPAGIYAVYFADELGRHEVKRVVKQ